ncbi:MAG: hypothetical protein KAH38_04135 [Candidatus Hydrogenedentes bacterium]|nr:hypothetical protein [Candidatus Hydrogenedentota bacterium]
MIAAGAGACAGWSAIAGTNNTAVPATPMKVLLWCWDTRMTWDDEPHLIQLKMAASDQHFSYTKCSESFQIGFRRLVDYCAENDIWGIVLWGFLRDAHGGVAAAQDLCLYARDRNVTIIPGVGLCAYGGYYYAGDHPFNLDTYLHKHPERASIAYEEGSGRKVQGVLDPSLPENQQWWRDGLEWMLETFAIGGINYEMGDFIINASQKAQTARRALGFNADGNILDMVVATHDLIERAYTLQPNGIFINALYRGYHQIRTLPDIPYVNAMNPKTVWQYTLTHMQRDEAFPDGFGDIPAHRQYGYLHWFNASTNTIAKDYTMDIARVFPAAQQLGFEFIGTYGELRANTPIADRNYRAQAAWAKNPALQYKDFE